MTLSEIQSIETGNEPMRNLTRFKMSLEELLALKGEYLLKYRLSHAENKPHRIILLVYLQCCVTVGQFYAYL